MNPDVNNSRLLDATLEPLYQLFPTPGKQYQELLPLITIGQAPHLEMNLRSESTTGIKPIPTRSTS